MYNSARINRNKQTCMLYWQYIKLNWLAIQKWENNYILKWGQLKIYTPPHTTIFFFKYNIEINTDNNRHNLSLP